MTFPVAVAIAVITGIVELITFVHRIPPGPPIPESAAQTTSADEDPTWSDLTGYSPCQGWVWA
jgi:hypothetical protein